MTQTSKIAGALIIAWIVFITTRGELPAYLWMLGIGSGSCSGSTCCNTSSGGGSGGGGVLGGSFPVNLTLGGSGGGNTGTPV